MTAQPSPEAAALVRAIRRAHPRQQWGGVTMFYVEDIHAFAERLARVGVIVDESREEEAA